MWGIWLDATLNSVLCRNGRKIRGPFRAAADFGDAMREALGDKISAYSDSDLARELSRQPGVRYYSEMDEDSGTSHVGLSSVRIRNVQLDDERPHGSLFGGGYQDTSQSDGDNSGGVLFSCLARLTTL